MDGVHTEADGVVGTINIKVEPWEWIRPEENG